MRTRSIWQWHTIRVAANRAASYDDTAAVFIRLEPRRNRPYVTNSIDTIPYDVSLKISREFLCPFAFALLSPFAFALSSSSIREIMAVYLQTLAIFSGSIVPCRE